MRRHRMLAGMTAGLMLIGTAAYAADLLVDATLSADADIDERTGVTVGPNSFDIMLWANGGLSSSQSGEARVATAYHMATDGTITADADPDTVETVNFKNSFNYNTNQGCAAPDPDTEEFELGCIQNPFVIAATLTVAAGTPAETLGTVTIAPAGSPGLTAPAAIQRYVVVVADEQLYFHGFFSPVENDGWNEVKGGRTVPLKFQVSEDEAGLDLVSDVDAIESIKTTRIACPVGDEPSADVSDATTTGKTELRYDESAEQFVFNWKTPKLPGNCYRVTVTLDGGATGTADFKLS